MKITQCILFVLVILLFQSAAEAQKAYMRISDIAGESADRNHRDWIDISSFDQSMATPAVATGATRRRASVNFDDFSIAKNLDRATPLLMDLCAKGQIIRELEIDVEKPSGGNLYNIKLVNVRINGINSAAKCAPQCQFEEILRVSFSKITWEYTDGRGGKITKTWNLETGS